MGRDKDRSDFLSGKTTKGEISPTKPTRFNSTGDPNLLNRLPQEKEKTHSLIKIITWLALGLAIITIFFPDSSNNRSQNSKKTSSTSNNKSSHQSQITEKQKKAVGLKQILFIGNGLTGVDIPDEVCKMLNSGNVETYKCHRLIEPGFHLTHHLKNLPDTVLKTDWELVVLQEHSSMLSKNADHPWTSIHHNSLRSIATRLSKNDPLFAYMAPWSEKILTLEGNSVSATKLKLDEHSFNAAYAVSKDNSIKITYLPVAQALVQALKLYSKDELFSGKNLARIAASEIPDPRFK